ncbi:hypothetical protein INO14_14950, partial [Staphylococcus aureus]|nr:hypothetical protein [Staphylococcus aureus]
QGYDHDADLTVLFHNTGIPCNVTSVEQDRIVCRPPKRLSFKDHHGGRSSEGEMIDDYEDDEDELPAVLVNDEIIVTV